MHQRFLHGSIAKPLFAMMFASWGALVANLLVGLADVFFLSLLKDEAILASVAFAGSVMFISTSLGIAFSVATSVLVSQKVAKHGVAFASQWLASIFCIALAVSISIIMLILPLLPSVLSFLGAEADVLNGAKSYLFIVLPSAPLVVMVMITSSALRSVAAAKLSLYVAFISALVNVVAAPVMIFTFDMGLTGAAWSTVLARVVAVLVCVAVLMHKGLWQLPKLQLLQEHAQRIVSLAIPAVLTHLVTPLGSLIVVKFVALFGTVAMAGQALVSSLAPLLFSVFFSMTGSAGPMIGGNVGAGQPTRAAEIFSLALVVIVAYTLFAWALLGFNVQSLVMIYGAKGVAAELLVVYAQVQVPLLVGLGLMALSNIIFNHLKKPSWAAWFNASRATVMMLLFCYCGYYFAGLNGVVIASSLTFLATGLASLIVAVRLFNKRYPENSLIIWPF